MKTITVPQIAYQKLVKKAQLFEQILSFLGNRKEATEIYSDKQIQEFTQADRMGSALRKRVRQMISKPKVRA